MTEKNNNALYEIAELNEIKPGVAILIKPGCRHRAVGKMKIPNVPIPAFDPDDEWFS